MKKIIQKFGYGGLIENYNEKNTQIDNYDVVMGLEPKFNEVCDNNPKALKIYYATGAYWAHQNKMIKKRTDEVNRRYNTNLSYSRLVSAHKSNEIADYILQIGSSYTIQTYPEEIRCKIHTIDQSFVPIKNINIEKKIKNSDRNHYLWFASGGTVLKGLDLLLDFFSQNKDLTLHVVGPIDSDFKEQILPLFKNFENIRLYGYLDLQSKTLNNIIQVSTYVILPSGSEGLPGSVLTGMGAGLIPIVSKYAAFDGINEMGYIIDDFNTESIANVIAEVQNLSDEEISKKMILASETVFSRFNLNRFEKQFIDFLSSVLKKGLISDMPENPKMHK
ncbi:MAG: glycosyltransferase [Turicibacter sp.]